MAIITGIMGQNAAGAPEQKDLAVKTLKVGTVRVTSQKGIQVNAGVTVPEPGGIVQAKADGKIDEGWLPATVVRTTGVSMTSSPSTIPRALPTGKIDEGWLPPARLRQFIVGASRSVNTPVRYFKLLSYTFTDAWESPDILIQLTSGISVSTFNDCRYGTLLLQARCEADKTITNDTRTNAMWLSKGKDIAYDTFFVAYKAGTVELWFKDNVTYNQYICTVISQTVGGAVPSKDIWTFEDATVPYDTLPEGYTFKDSIPLLNTVPATDVAINNEPTDTALTRGQIGTPTAVTYDPALPFDLDTYDTEGQYSFVFNTKDVPISKDIPHTPANIIRFTSARLSVIITQSPYYRVIQYWQQTILDTEVKTYIRIGFKPSVTANRTWSAWKELVPSLQGATATTAGSAGIVPAPAITDVEKYLKGDGTWASLTANQYAADSGPSLTAVPAQAEGAYRAPTATTDGEGIDIQGLGRFCWSSTSVAPVDNETCILAAGTTEATPGRWLLVSPSWDAIRAEVCRITDELEYNADEMGQTIRTIQAEDQTQNTAIATLEKTMSTLVIKTGLTASFNNIPAAGGTVTFTGGVLGTKSDDIVQVRTKTPVKGVIVSGYVDEDDTVTLVATNVTTSAITTSFGLYYITILRHGEFPQA